jgi:FkbM family methyltransferase
MHKRPPLTAMLTSRSASLALLAAALLMWLYSRSLAALLRGSAPAPAAAAPPPPPSPLAAAHAQRYGAFTTASAAGFCAAAVADPAPDLAGAFQRVLFEGSPRYWMVPPMPDFAFWVYEGIAGGGAVVSVMHKQYGAFQDYFRDSPPGAILLDVGGNVGLTSMPIAAMGRRVYVFEPVPLNQRVLKLAACFNGFGERFTLVGAAVGAAEGTVDVFIPEGRADNTALGEAGSTANVGGRAARTPVPMVALDAWARGALAPSDLAAIWLLKIDVQGYELRVMEGARELLAALPPSAWVVAEHDPNLMAKAGLADPTADIAFMAGLGFSAHLTWRGEEVPESGWATVPLEEYGRDMWYRKVVVGVAGG